MNKRFSFNKDDDDDDMLFPESILTEIGLVLQILGRGQGQGQAQAHISLYL